MRFVKSPRYTGRLLLKSTRTKQNPGAGRLLTVLGTILNSPHPTARCSCCMKLMTSNTISSRFIRFSAEKWARSMPWLNTSHCAPHSVALSVFISHWHISCGAWGWREGAREGGDGRDCQGEPIAGRNMRTAKKMTHNEEAR